MGHMDGQATDGAVSTPGAQGWCHEEVCLTCSDVAVPSRIIELRSGSLAVVEREGTTALISMALVDAGPGDTVLVHAGEAIAVVQGA